MHQSSYRDRRFPSRRNLTNLTYTEHPLRVLDTKERSTRRETIRMFKIQWNHHTEEEATWETESYLQHNFLDFFQANLRT
jgi:hypothetical protein